jgi:photosystem II stability/assembly factor-like uncharacterized protein
VVRPCNASGPAAAVGTWENITPAGIPQNSANDYGSNSFVINPRDTATVYLGSNGHGVFKTTDCGATWIKISTGAGSAALDGGRQWSMVIDPIEPNVLYTISGYGPGGVYKSRDGGVSWTQILTKDVTQYTPYGGFIERVTMDPTDNRHLLVSFHTPCEGPYAPDCFAETSDAGTTWRLIKVSAPNAEDGGQIMLDRKTWLFGSTFGGIWRTGDGGTTWARVTSEYASDSLYQTKSGTYLVAGPNGILQSADCISWSKLPNSPGARALAGDGTTVYSVDRYNRPFYHQALESSLTSWREYPSTVSKGGWMLKYDPDHRLLYSSNESAGFWRVLTK